MTMLQEEETSLWEGTTLKFENVRVIIVQDENKVCFGELYVGKDSFGLSTERENSFRIDAKDLVLQAICREDECSEKPGVYCQIQGDRDEEEETPVETIYIIPNDSSQVEKIFEALCDLVRRNPVHLTYDHSSEEEEEEWYGNVPWNVDNYNAEQFEDAEETDPS